ncbi:MAG TPA: transketolase C-terminal domain-containing protein [bacterium]|nr:transketolase C-terminal domain-containing protein [bacterium]HPQ65812.1 transketolase C-terminal domain-containing protein [bacterium]
MSTIKALTGNEAGAEAMRQIDPDVVPAYPITPQTELMQKFSGFVSDGKVTTEMILVESEHSAMSAAVGAAAAGARVMTATSANGLALMWEVVYIAASSRLPIVMAVVNRALSAPINIHCDHSDTMGARDSGWIQIYGENSQEVYDNLIQAVKIAEDPRVLLPVMSTHDGFIISHTMERVETLEDSRVRSFVGEHTARYPLLDTAHPVTYGPLDLQDYYFEHKMQQAQAVIEARKVILEVGEEYGKLSGRSYGFFDEYMTEDAEYVVVALGSAAGTAKAAVDELRERGDKVGVLKLRVFRPFPAREVAEALRGAKAVAVMDRSESFSGNGGPVAAEVRAALYGRTDVPVSDYVFGLGGRDLRIDQVQGIFHDLKRGSYYQQEARHLGVRE